LLNYSTINRKKNNQANKRITIKSLKFSLCCLKEKISMGGNIMVNKQTKNRRHYILNQTGLKLTVFHIREIILQKWNHWC